MAFTACVINGREASADVAPDTALLWIARAQQSAHRHGRDRRGCGRAGHRQHAVPARRQTHLRAADVSEPRQSGTGITVAMTAPRVHFS